MYNIYTRRKKDTRDPFHGIWKLQFVRSGDLRVS